ncbi:MAG: 16S rRNA (cytidine(1402)-2'-O)-methyltransferase, partial [Firmicutes bacterium HGW-Firmicutes-13]
LETLREVDFIAAEDTRRTIKLLNYYKIRGSLISYHEHNKEGRGREIIKLLEEGKKVALVSDAGTPGISDPGYELIKESINRNIEVISLPGPCAAVAAVTVSGFSIRKFALFGFLSSKKKDKKKELEEIRREKKTIVIYEAPHRLVKTLKSIIEVTGDREAAVCREMTKKFEEIKRGKLSQIIPYYEANPPKGEITLVISGREEEEPQAGKSLSEGVEEVKKLKEGGLREKEAVKKAAGEFNLSPKELYKQVIEEKEKTK